MSSGVGAGSVEPLQPPLHLFLHHIDQTYHLENDESQNQEIQ